MKIGDYVKTYNLCTGEIKIGKIEHIIKKKKNISVWSGAYEYEYKNEDIKRTLSDNTAIYDKNNERYVFRYASDGEQRACFSTIIVNFSEYLEYILVDNEKIKIDID